MVPTNWTNFTLLQNQFQVIWELICSLLYSGGLHRHLLRVPPVRDVSAGDDVQSGAAEGRAEGQGGGHTTGHCQGRNGVRLMENKWTVFSDKISKALDHSSRTLTMISNLGE